MEKELERSEVKPDEKEPVTLKGDAAVLLWLEGKDAWNRWMEENPNANVDFDRVDFSYKALKGRFPDNENLQKLIEENKDEEVISFEYYKFSGKADFYEARFSGDAIFFHARFSGDASFFYATFSGKAEFYEATLSGDAHFNYTTFSGKADFNEATLSGDAHFNYAKFSGKADFYEATLSGEAGFFNATFSDKADFYEATFSSQANFNEATFSGKADFNEATFSGEAGFFNATFSGEADFNEATFSGKAIFFNATFSGKADFFNATFSGDADFYNATFSGDTDFYNTTFSGYANFFNATFGGEAIFIDTEFSDNVNYQSSNFEASLIFVPKSADKIKLLNFEGAAFEKLFTITGNYNCIPDLRQTKTSHHVDLSNLSVKLNRNFIKNWGVEKALNEEDSERLCRLKEIAESNKNHKRALAFNADELRASRWGVLNPLQSILDCIYSVTSNYGQSIARPFCWLVFSIFMFASYTSSHSNNNKIEPLDKIIIATEISVATVTPFLSMSKGARQEGLKTLHGEKRIRWFNTVSYLHAGISFIFIFLIGLGLRNRFRI